MSSSPGILTLGSALRSPSEESMAVATHGLGLALSVVGSVVLLSTVWVGGDPWVIGGCAFYALTLIAVYAASTLSHVYMPERLNRLFRALDQGFIYLLIVGTFTPLVMAYLRTPFWLGFYAVILSVAIGGFLSKTVFAYRLDGLAVWLYEVLGWSEALAAKPMLQLIPAAGLYWIVAGGLFYTVGTIFLVVDIRRYHFHAIWHVMVIAGSICHFIAIYGYVALRS
jgi:hemolysin III